MLESFVMSCFETGCRRVVLEDLSGQLGLIPCNKHLFSNVEQQENAPMMSKTSTDDIVVPNCWQTPLQQLSRWEVGGRHTLISETRLLFSSPCEPQPLRRSGNRLLLRGNSDQLSASPILVQ